MNFTPMSCINVSNMSEFVITATRPRELIVRCGSKEERHLWKYTRVEAESKGKSTKTLQSLFVRLMTWKRLSKVGSVAKSDADCFDKGRLCRLP
jgi:hypothetical protein